MGTAASVPLNRREDPCVVSNSNLSFVETNFPSEEESLVGPIPTVCTVKEEIQPLQPATLPPCLPGPSKTIKKEKKAAKCKEPTTTPNTAKSYTLTDGYKWRKYGSKKSKNIHRAYYKCRHQDCTVKKITEIETGQPPETEKVTYKGTHNHEPPAVSHASAASQDELKEIIRKFFSEQTSNSEKSAYEPKIVVSIPSNVSPQEDGFTWRKYGQKIVKGSPHPRSYFKCTQDQCNVKKQIELEDEKHICTYEGRHNHHELPDVE